MSQDIRIPKILRSEARCRCGHYEEIRGLTSSELSYMHYHRSRFDCTRCEVEFMLSNMTWVKAVLRRLEWQERNGGSYMPTSSRA